MKSLNRQKYQFHANSGMQRKILSLILICVSFSLSGWIQIPNKRAIRVGVYENAPKIFTADDGSITGFWPDLIREMAKQEDWEIIWVTGTWEECLARLENNEIDMLPDVGWTEERAAKYSFSNETVLVSWARVYVPKGSDIETILDLEGKKVAGLAGSLNFDGPEGIKQLSQKFDVQSTFIAKSSYQEVFQALELKEVDAGVTNKDFGDLNEQNYDIERTPIVIQPTRLQFAFTKGAELSPYLIKSIDTNVKALKSDPDSMYYKAQDHYLGGSSVTGLIEIIPPWMNNLLLAGGGIILFLLAVSVTSGIQVRRQTAKLSASETRHRALLENIPDMIFRVSGEGQFLDYHSTVENSLYIKPQDFLGKTVSDILPPDLAQSMMEKARLALESGEIQLFEYQLTLDDGIHDFEARYTASGKDEVIAIIRDISARKKAEKDLRESQQRYQTLALASPVGIFHADNSGKTTYVNPTWCQMAGISADEALGLGWLKAVHPEDRAMIETNWIKNTQAQSPSGADYRFIHPDGSIVWVVGQAVPEKNAEGEVIGYVGTITDITERKQTEKALQRAIVSERAALAETKTIHSANLALSHSLDLDEILELLLDHLSQIVPYDHAAVMLLDNNNQLTVYAMRGYTIRSDTLPIGNLRFDASINPVVESVIENSRCLSVDDTRQYPDWKYPFGIPSGISWMGVPLIAGGQVLGLYSLNKTSPGFFTKEYQELAETIAAQAAIAIQNAKLHKELQAYASDLEQRVSDRTAELAKRVSEVENLNTSMVKLMEDLQSALEKAESADRLKSAFLATMSHELRTPLNSIIGFSGILLQKMVGPLSDEQEKQLKMVQDSARHLLELINDVLDISKIEADQLVISCEPFDMQTAIQKSIDKIRPMAEKKGLAFTSDISPQIGEISADRRRVEQILLNLLNNAVKFTEQGEVHLECQIENDRVVTRVKDTGIGIKAEDFSTLFKPFRQINTGISRQYEGTGLGLSICKRLVELMGGEIWAESEPGIGSTFTFTLPV
ncbi:MAG: PAS domain S-box protein [Anaerolineales bacterium]|nr:PAS domain S-box protein [Anaerolineales bacterium]